MCAMEFLNSHYNTILLFILDKAVTDTVVR